MSNYKFFLSYSRSDSETAIKLTTLLKEAGADIWLDQIDIQPGSIWDVEIERALEACNCLLFILSKSSVASNNVMNEVYYALEEGKRVVPLKIEDCKTPFRIKRLHYIDLYTNYEQGIKQLFKAVSLEEKQGLIEKTKELSIKYNLANIKRYFVVALSGSDLDSFCLSYFDDVYNEFVPDQSKSTRIDLLLKYIKQNNQYDRLLSLMKEENPVQYDKNAPYIE